MGVSEPVRGAGEVRVLLVEDDRSSATVVDAQLRAIEGVDCRLEVVPSLGEALTALAARPFDLVIADLHLPDSPAEQTIPALVRSCAQPIIALTADHSPALRRAALASGAYDFMVKGDYAGGALPRAVRLAALQGRTLQSLRASEARLKAILNTEPECVKLVDASANLIEMNEAGLRMIEADSLEAVRGRCILELVMPEHRSGFLDMTRQVARDGRQRTLEFAMVGLQGTRRWLSTQAVRLVDEASGEHLVLAITRDMSERKRADELHALEVAVTRRFAEAPSTSDALKAALRAVCESESWELGRYLRADDGAGVLRFGEAWSVADPGVQAYVEESRRMTYAPGVGLVGKVWQSQEPMWVSDIGADPRVARPELARNTGLRAAFVVPVSAEGRPVGVLIFHSRAAREPDPPLLHAVRIIGTLIGQFSRRAEAERRAERLTRMYAALAAANEAVLRAGAPQEVYERACAIAVEAGGFLLGTVYRLEAQGTRLARVAAVGAAASAVEAVAPSLDPSEPAGQGLVGHACRSGEPAIANDYAADPRTQGRRSLRRDYEVGSAAVFPLRAEGGLAGVFGLQHAERDAFTPELIALLRRLADNISFALDNFAREARRREAEDALEESKARFRQTFELAATGIAHVDLEGRFLAANLRLCEMLGYAAEELRGLSVKDVSHPEDRELTDAERAEMRAGRADSMHLEKRYLRKDGSILWAKLTVALARDPRGQPQYEIAVFEDITALKQREAQLAYLAQFDALTGLPNRALLLDRFSQAIVQARRRGACLGVLFIDLDGFKLVNDTQGHRAGDELLREMAARLKAALRPGDTVARLSGDEFAVVLTDLARPDDAGMVAQKLLDAVAAPCSVLGHEVLVTASIGVATYPGDGDGADALLGAADAAMYRAKQSGRNGYQFFTAEINLRSRARAQLSAELHRALEREEFSLVYQPKVDLGSRRPSGAEALLRWAHPERGAVPPTEFIPVLEETGLITAVGEWALRRACADLRAWVDAGLAAGPVSVNLSARQFRRQNLDARIKAAIAAAGIAPALLELEITESQLMHDPEQSIRIMRSLRDAGVRIAIDDFGTGYSSLSYLSHFPIASLKIDRSFVRDMTENPSHAAIVRTIIDMAHTLGFEVVAEGVETEAQAEYLRRHGCEKAQGYLFARPMPAADLSALIAASARSAA